MSYIAFSRKYRPQTFDDIIGQSHVTTTLKNAISQDRVAHAYLFAGPRGVGKTTAARILAKALNCEKGPSPKPCDACSSCKEIVQGNNLDVLEIDGASNRGIDEIRNLRENVKFTPSRGRFKIYIIDEVHMLTPEAFNALLKTLEEPPAHAKFIFATTQAHKVPPTILSRCQRFDFRRIPSKDIVENLKAIANLEGSKIDDEALALIAKYSDGGMRDAQVMLDQITSSAKGKVSAGDIAKSLGLVEDDALFQLSAAIRGRDAAKALLLLDGLIKDGKDALLIVTGLLEHFRNVSVAKISQDAGNLIDAGPDKVKRYKNESAEFTIEGILYAVYTLSNTMDLIKKTGFPRAPLEAAVVKLTLGHPVVPINEIISRIEGLERKYAAGNVTASSTPPIRSAGSQNPPRTTFMPEAITAPEKKNDADVKTKTFPAAAMQNNIETVAASWQSIINNLMPKKMSASSYLREGFPLSVDEKSLVIGFPKNLQFHKEALESPDNKALIEAAVKEVLDKNYKISFVLVEHSAVPANKGEYSDGDSPDDFTGSRDADGREADPIVKSAMEIFGADASNGAPGKGRVR